MKACALFLLLSAFLFAQSPKEVEITAEPTHHLILQNAQVRVFYVDVAPGAETLTHWHRHDYVFVTLGPTEIVNAVEGKDPLPQKLADGDTRLVPGNFAHHVHDTAPTDFRNVTVELLQDEKLRQTSPGQSATWDEDRGLDILEGGTKQVLWIKDSIRATEFELQPKAAVPSSPHSHPLLLIAVNDFDLYLQDPRTHGPHANGAHESMPAAKHFASGSAIWLTPGFSRPLTNAGHSAAKFVTLEFP
jgi:quercetin dioxygenase-like cupin family protein